MTHYIVVNGKYDGSFKNLYQAIQRVKYLNHVDQYFKYSLGLRDIYIETI